MDLIIPQWPAPACVRACFSTRSGGRSAGSYAGLNLGAHVGDDPAVVARNRQQLASVLDLPQAPLWLNQVHGTEVVVADAASVYSSPPIADAAVTHVTGIVLSVMTADCLPVLFCNRSGSVVATAHAGWRGLCNGVLEQTVSRMACPAEDVMAWMGPAIGPCAFEVGEDVRQAFLDKDNAAVSAFMPTTSGKWLADLYLLARQRLATVGVSAVFGGEHCTFSDATSFYSYRRDGQTGRMSGLIWMVPTF